MYSGGVGGGGSGGGGGVQAIRYHCALRGLKLGMEPFVYVFMFG